MGINGDRYTVYSTYLGGSELDEGPGDGSGAGIAVDESGVAFVTGETRSTDFPLHDPLQPEFGGGTADAFISPFDPFGCPPLY
ncbi:MAG TPA: hypothetical protein EYN74_02645 [Nitrospirales bacterium]|nr:hypothetical protein [Nitrospirales bacterium]HIN33983.1 hypothetical protein [Nitrospirales bacterium]